MRRLVMTSRGLGVCEGVQKRHGDMLYLEVTLKTGETTEFLNTEVRFLDMETEIEEMKRRKRLDQITGKIDEKF
mgnify:CR=1 FL=1